MTTVLCPSSSMIETSNLGTQSVMLVLFYGECVCVCARARMCCAFVGSPDCSLDCFISMCDCGKRHPIPR